MTSALRSPNDINVNFTGLHILNQDLIEKCFTINFTQLAFSQAY